METITHREMRNRSGEILRRVEGGESIQITNNGHLAAMIVPVGGNVLDDLISRGQARAATAGVDVLKGIQRGTSELSIQHMLDESRGRW